MLSEGVAGEDNIFSLKDGMLDYPREYPSENRNEGSRPILPGILKLELDKESYERAGLVGKAVRSGGRKHVKARYGRRCRNPLTPI